MRYALFLFIALIYISIIGSCANVPPAIVNFQERTYRLCAEGEVKGNDYVGKACFRYCKEWKLWHQQIDKNCKIWVLDVLDLRDESDYLKLRAGGFVLINKNKVQ